MLRSDAAGGNLEKPIKHAVIIMSSSKTGATEGPLVRFMTSKSTAGIGRSETK